MDAITIGKAIQFLRKRAGYTQVELADRLMVSDKAVSRWERGVGVPDISLLRKLSIILDTDIDSLLQGEVAIREDHWKGLLVLDEYSTADIENVPVFDHLLSYFLLVRIRDIFILCSAPQKERIKTIYNCGEKLGINLNYLMNDKPGLSDSLSAYKDCFGSSSIMMVYGSLFLYGVDLSRFIQRGLIHSDKCIVLSIVKNSSDRRINFNSDKKVIDGGRTDSISTRYNYCYLPVLFCHGGIQWLLQANCSDYDSLIQSLIRRGSLYTELMDKGFIGITVKDKESAVNVSWLIKIIQKETESLLNNPGEISYRRGFIDEKMLMEYAEGSQFKDYLIHMLTV